MKARRRWLGFGVLALALVGCGSDDSGSGGSDMAAVAPAPPDAGRAAESAAGSSAGSAAGAAGAPSAGDAAGPSALKLEPQLIRTAKLSVVVDDVAAKAGEAAAYAKAAGGAIAGDDRSGSDRTARALLVLKVPPPRMDGLLDQLGGMGTERSRSSTTEDVTEDVADIGARVATMQASIARVRAILARADKIGDVVTVEGELSRRVTELESLQARQRALAGQTTYATVTLTLTAKSTQTEAAPPVDRDGFVGGLQDGWNAFTATVGWLLTVVGAVLPFLLILVPAGFAARWALRRSRPAPTPPVAP